MNRRTLIIGVVAMGVILLILVLVSSLLSRPKSTNQTGGNNSQVDQVVQKEIEDGFERQSLGDANYGKAKQEIANKYPWLGKLPIETDRYYVYFDVKAGTFFGAIYDSSKESEIKTEAENRLRELGINTSDFKFNWETR